jgi:colanic acid/amylovoran biosynthesis protein
MFDKNEQQKSLNVLITGSSLSANKGAMAMTLVVAEQIRSISPNCQLWLASKYPKQDMMIAAREGIELVDAPPSRVVTTTFLRSLLVMLIRPIPTRWLFDRIMHAYSRADVVLDLGGITFSDDRDWRGLLLSIGWIVPALAVGTPFVKLSQAFGPFQKWRNRIAARLLLKKCSLLIARGQSSALNIQQLLGPGQECHVCADVAFLLKPASDNLIDEFLRGHGLPQRGFVGISPSMVIEGKAGANRYRTVMAELIENVVHTTGCPVVLVPHAWPFGGRGYGDMDLCCDIYDKLDRKDNVFIIKEDLDAVMLKSIISRSEVLVSCRFHAMIAALGSNVPTMVVSWGHKYNEIMELFGIQNFACDFSIADGDRLTRLFAKMWQNREQLREQIKQNLEDIKKSSQANFELLRMFLDKNGLL